MAMITCSNINCNVLVNWHLGLEEKMSYNYFQMNLFLKKLYYFICRLCQMRMAQKVMVLYILKQRRLPDMPLTK